MPEPDTDKHRMSPELPMGLEKPNPYPTKPMIRTTDEEAYQFRKPNLAYENGGMEHELPDGLVSDGTPNRHWGPDPVSREDNG